MTDSAPSSTAVGVAWLRAAHLVVDQPPRILDDSVIIALLGASVEELASRAERLTSPTMNALRAHVVLRSRYAEDRLAAAVERVRQYVILGAGLDTFAYRQPPWASELRVFEVDQPASQAMKREQVAKAGLIVPRNVVYSAVDFEHESLADGLSRAGVELGEPVFFAWLGVTMYLTEAAVDAVLRFVAALPAGSEIVFTFAQPRTAAERVALENTDREPTLAERAAASGEPWITYFTPDELEQKLRSFGFSAIEFLTPDAAVARYFQGRTDSLRPPARASIVSATV